MSELAPNTEHQEMIEAFDQAQAAAQEAGMRSTINVGSSLAIESVGKTGEPNLQFSIDNGRRHNQNQMVGDTTKHGEVGDQPTHSAYESRIRWDQDDPTKVEASTQINRVDSKGESYKHAFKNPDTARKFNQLIARQITRRAETKIADADIDLPKAA